MPHVSGSISAGTRHPRERAAREAFFAMLGVSCICLMVGIVAVSHFIA